MKNWITSLLIFAAVLLIVIMTGQNWRANARDSGESLSAPPLTPHVVAIIYCERSGADIKVVSSSNTGGHSLTGKSCAEALDMLLTADFKIESATTDAAGAFNYLLIKRGLM